MPSATTYVSVWHDLAPYRNDAFDYKKTDRYSTNNSIEPSVAQVLVGGAFLVIPVAIKKVLQHHTEQRAYDQLHEKLHGILTTMLSMVVWSLGLGVTS